MVSDAAEIESKVLQLSPAEQFDLYIRLRDKFDPLPEEKQAEVEAARDAEIQRRIREVDEGKAVLFTMEEVENRIEALKIRLRNQA